MSGQKYDRAGYLATVDQEAMVIREAFQKAGTDLEDQVQSLAARNTIGFLLAGIRQGLDTAREQGLDQLEGAFYALNLVIEGMPSFGVAAGADVGALLDMGFTPHRLQKDDDQ